MFCDWPINDKSKKTSKAFSFINDNTYIYCLWFNVLVGLYAEKSV